MSLPGGDDFGPARSTCTSTGLEALGATFELAPRLHRGHGRPALSGAGITLEFPSVGATENIADGRGAGQGHDGDRQRRPRARDRRPAATSSTGMGAEIEGAGTSTIMVDGVEPGTLRAGRSTVVVPDRIEAATFLAAPAVAGGEIDARRTPGPTTWTCCCASSARWACGRADHRRPVGAWPRAERLRSVDVATLPYPGVATDYKPLLTAMLAVADGVGIVTENLFAGRFRYVDELVRMGADIRTDGHHAVVRGVAAAVGRAGAGPRHPRRRRAGRGRRWPPTARRSSPTPTTSTAATRTSWASCAVRSAPTSSAADP